MGLGSPASINAFAQCTEDSLNRLDAVIEIAAIATPRFNLAEEGHEPIIAVNVLRAVLLGLLLLPKLCAAGVMKAVRPHLTVVSSGVIFHTGFPERHAPDVFPRLADPTAANSLTRYNVSKLMLAMAVREMAAQLLREVSLIGQPVEALLAQSSEEGSRSTAISEDKGGCNNGGSPMGRVEIVDGIKPGATPVLADVSPRT
ncbi:hypothetical protein DL769_003897 [Monosporascus sp. CRB-8-3]|nr:hypothetical protein DL769_003897 [Monosporascus sp. CRB-8-3]